MADDDADAGALVMPSLVPYGDEDDDGQDDEEEKKTIKKKKEKKKKKKKKKQKGKKTGTNGLSTMALPSVEALMSSNDLPDFLETAAKKKKEDDLARIAEIQAMKHNDSASSNLEHKAVSQQPSAARKKAEQKTATTTKRPTPAATANRKRRAGASNGAPDPFQGLHPWAQGAGALRQKKVKEQQRKKVARGQTFTGRTWKSEAEMVLRQQYD